MLDLTQDEIGSIVRVIAPVWYSYASKYDEQKYPPSELKRLREVFSTPESVFERDIVAALVWKYGHTGKANYPGRQRALAGRIAMQWRKNAILPTQDPNDAFHRWRSLLGPTSFITVCFLLHLVHPDTLPILDQHNYRSVNLLIAGFRSDWRVKAKPSMFDDLLTCPPFLYQLL